MIALLLSAYQLNLTFKFTLRKPIFWHFVLLKKAASCLDDFVIT